MNKHARPKSCDFATSPSRGARSLHRSEFTTEWEFRVPCRSAHSAVWEFALLHTQFHGAGRTATSAEWELSVLHTSWR
eukprot:6039570-Alexandrium_andersonii.AAC.1